MNNVKIGDLGLATGLLDNNNPELFEQQQNQHQHHHQQEKPTPPSALQVEREMTTGTYYSSIYPFADCNLFCPGDFF